MKLTKINNLNNNYKRKKRYEYKKNFFSFILWFLIFLTALGIIKAIFISHDIDEGYAVAQAYRLIKGDKLLLDMWEPHQLSAYLPAIFMRIFITITGSTDYIVIYLRVVGIIIHALLGFLLYKTARNFIGNTESAFLTLLHVNFLAKWVQMPEFELMNYWYLLVTFLCFLTYYTISGKRIYLAVAGVFTMLQICNYPTMILLYPVYILGMIMLGKNNPEINTKKDIAVTTVSAVIPGMLFICYLFSYMDLQKIKNSISYIMLDPSHTEQTLISKLGSFGISALQDIGEMLLIFGIIFCLVYIIHKLTFLCKRKNKCVCITKCESMKKMILITFLTEIVFYCIWMVIGCLFKDQNQFYLQNRYLLIAIAGSFIYLTYQRKASAIYWFGIIPGFVAAVSALFVTNMTVNVGYSKLFICVISMFMLLFMTLKESDKISFIARIMSYLSFFSVFSCLLLCRLVLIRVTSCLPVTINADLEKVTTGPLKGIYMLEHTAQNLNMNSSLISEYVAEKNNLLYFGCENIIYLCTDAQISAASVQGTSVFNEVFLEYLDQHPEKYPTVIAVDKNFSTDYYRVYNPYNYIIEDWIVEEFDYSEIIETNEMILYIR